MTTISALPPAPQPTDDRSTFNAKCFALIAALATFITEANAQAGENNDAASDAAASQAAALASQVAALASETASATNAATAAANGGATPWVSGTTYAIGDVRWSPADGRVYRRRTNGAGTTDPSADATNWRLAMGPWWGAPVDLTVANNGATLAAGTLYRLDSVGGAFTVSLPAGMTNEDWIGFVDKSGKLSLNNVTLLSNGNGNFREGDTSLVMDMAYDSFELFKTSTGLIEQ